MVIIPIHELAIVGYRPALQRRQQAHNRGCVGLRDDTLEAQHPRLGHRGVDDFGERALVVVDRQRECACERGLEVIGRVLGHGLVIVDRSRATRPRAMMPRDG